MIHVGIKAVITALTTRLMGVGFIYVTLLRVFIIRMSGVSAFMSLNPFRDNLIFM